MSMQTQYSGGFQNAPIEASYAFRAAMTAMARPGEIRTVVGAQPPAPLSVAAGTLLLTLCDPDTSVHLAGETNSDEVRSWLAFHTGAPIVPAEKANFAVGEWDDLMPLTQYHIGTPEYPDRSATLIVECQELKQQGAVLNGPGIKDTRRFSVPDSAALNVNARLYPLGCDFFFTAVDRVAALPRSTQIRAEG